MLALDIKKLEDVPGERPGAPHIVRSSLQRGAAKTQSPMISAKCVSCGEERYDASGIRRAIYPGRFLLSAPGEAFDLSVKANAKGCCIYLDPNDLRQMFGQMISVDMEGGDRAQADFWTVALPMGASDFGKKIEAITRNNADSDAQELTASLAELLGRLRGLDNSLPFKRPSARRELIARLETARAFLLEAADRLVSLDDLEQAACLSRFHLSRSFTLAYGVPPLRFHQNIRLDVAAKRVRSGESIRVIAADLHFSNLSSFSRAYARRHGRRPSANQH